VPNNETPWPHVKAKEGTLIVRWGRGGWIFIMATLAVIGSSALMVYRVDAGEEADKKMEKNIKIIDQNIDAIDEQTRLNAQAAGLANKQLRALLQAQGITERIEPPEVPKSKLKELE
jgi:hypothetical protein